MSDAGDPSEADYTSAAHTALERGDLRLALEQIAGALSYRPNAPELRALLDVALSRSNQPLTLLPHRGEAFYGVGAVRAAALARAGKLGEALSQLFDVVSFRPSAPYLVWIGDWRARGLRGVGADAVASAAARFHGAIDREGTVAPENLVSLAALLAALRAERPRARETLLRLEVITLRLLGDLERAEELVEGALLVGESCSLLIERGLNQRQRGDFAGAVVSLRRALTLEPSDTSVAADLADACVRAGYLPEAAESYRSLTGTAKEEHAANAGLCVDALIHPTDGVLRARALEATEKASTLPELGFLLRVGRTLSPPWVDVLAFAIEDIIAHLSEPPSHGGPVHIRLELDRPLPASARWLFRTAAADRGIVADLLAGDGVPASLEVPHVAMETSERVTALCAQPLDLDRWAARGPALALEEAKEAFDAPLDGVARTPSAFERQRLAILSLALRDSNALGAAPVAWALSLAAGEDAWAARAALLALGAAARRNEALVETVLAASNAALTHDDTRGAAASAIRLHLGPEDPCHDRGRDVAQLLRASLAAARPHAGIMTP